MQVKSKKAFTLIELLVVVLIIGILSAVALPQYNRAVDRSRITPYIGLAQEIIKAEKIYFMANGRYTPRLDLLDMDVTKSCQTLAGTCKNELYNCQGGFGFDMSAGVSGTECVFNGTPRIVLTYCPSGNRCSSGDGASTMVTVAWSIETGKISSCTAASGARWESLCNYIRNME